MVFPFRLLSLTLSYHGLHWTRLSRIRFMKTFRAISGQKKKSRAVGAPESARSSHEGSGHFKRAGLSWHLLTCRNHIVLCVRWGEVFWMSVFVCWTSRKILLGFERKGSVATRTKFTANRLAGSSLYFKVARFCANGIHTCHVLLIHFRMVYFFCFPR